MEYFYLPSKEGKSFSQFWPLKYEVKFAINEKNFGLNKFFTK